MRKEEVFQHIASDPEICHGKPCIKGTRIPVYLVVDMLAEGESPDVIVQEYPSLTLADIQAAIHYAARLCEYVRDPATIFG